MYIFVSVWTLWRGPCDARFKITSSDKDIKSKLKITSLEVDSACDAGTARNAVSKSSALKESRVDNSPHAGIPSGSVGYPRAN